MKPFYNIVYLFCICIILLIFIHVSKQPFNINKWCILLTTCVNRKSQTPEQRKEILSIYQRSISDWLTKTTLPICVVDSSDYPFNEFADTRLNVISFTCKETENPTVSESISILHALAHLKTYEYILKITGRYYIPDIKETLENIPYTYDLYLQATRTPDLQNSEVFGFKRNLGETIFTPLADKTDTLSMEESIWNVTYTNKYTWYVLPYLQNIHKVPRGGDKRVLDPL